MGAVLSLLSLPSVPSSRNSVVDQRPCELGNPHNASGGIEILTVNISM